MTDPYSPENIADTKARACQIGLNTAIQAGKVVRKIVLCGMLLGLFVLSCINLMVYFAMPSTETAGEVIPNIWGFMVMAIQAVYYYGMYRVIRKILGKSKRKEREQGQFKPYDDQTGANYGEYKMPKK